MFSQIKLLNKDKYIIGLNCGVLLGMQSKKIYCSIICKHSETSFSTLKSTVQSDLIYSWFSKHFLALRIFLLAQKPCWSNNFQISMVKVPFSWKILIYFNIFKFNISPKTTFTDILSIYEIININYKVWPLIWNKEKLQKVFEKARQVQLNTNYFLSLQSF